MKQLKNFNFSLTDNTTYIGNDLLDFYSNALLTFPTAKNMTVVPNVKSVIKLPSFNLGSTLQADTIASATSWSPSGEGTLAEKSFTVTPVKIQLEYAKGIFEQDFLNEYMKAGSNGEELIPAPFANYITSQIMKQISNDLEVITWQGVGSGSTYPQELSKGLMAQLSGDSAVVRVTGTSITTSNVIAEITKVYNALPSAVLLNYTDVKLYASSAIVRAYRIASANLAAGQGYNMVDAGQLKLNFLGFEVVECPGLSANQMVFASEKNLVLLTDLMEDFEKDSSIVVLDMFQRIGVPTVRIALRFKFGVGYKIGSEIVAYY